MFDSQVRGFRIVIVCNGEEVYVLVSVSDNWDKAVDILGLKGKVFSGGIERCDFSVAQLSELVNLGLTKLDYSFNQSPMVEVFLEVGKQAEAFGATVTFIGFLESKGRPDAILTVEGIEITDFPDSASLIMEFSQAFHEADEFTTNAEMLRAWFD